MNLSSAVEPVPIETGKDGVLRIGQTGVTLETLVELFDAGLDADEIAREFDGMDLATVYSVIGYYLKHRQDLEGYLGARRAHFAEARHAGAGESHAMRARLEARLRRFRPVHLG